METFGVSTDSRIEVIDITDRVHEHIPTGATGSVTIFVKHTTAALTINEGESRLLRDFERALDELVAETDWAHDQIDDNADAHIRALLVGPSVTVPIDDGRLHLGTWQSVLLVECDGPRRRTISVSNPTF